MAGSGSGSGSSSSGGNATSPFGSNAIDYSKLFELDLSLLSQNEPPSARRFGNEHPRSPLQKNGSKSRLVVFSTNRRRRFSRSTASSTTRRRSTTSISCLARLAEGGAHLSQGPPHGPHARHARGRDPQHDRRLDEGQARALGWATSSPRGSADRGQGAPYPRDCTMWTFRQCSISRFLAWWSHSRSSNATIIPQRPARRRSRRSLQSVMSAVPSAKSHHAPGIMR
jgi:hypothetical protein